MLQSFMSTYNKEKSMIPTSRNVIKKETEMIDDIQERDEEDYEDEVGLIEEEVQIMEPKISFDASVKENFKEMMKF